MAGTDFTLDRKTRDLVDADNGWFEEDETSGTAVSMQCEHFFDEWWGDPDAGRRRLTDVGAGDSGVELVRVEYVRALKPLAAERRIADVVVEAERATPAGRIAVGVGYRNVATQEPIDLQLDPFGG